MLVAARITGEQDRPSRITPYDIDLKPWKWASPVALILFILVIGIYVLFSPLGVA